MVDSREKILCEAMELFHNESGIAVLYMALLGDENASVGPVVARNLLEGAKASCESRGYDDLVEIVKFILDEESSVTQEDVDAFMMRVLERQSGEEYCDALALALWPAEAEAA